MAVYGPGSEGEAVAKIQRYLYEMARVYKITIPKGFSITGAYSPQTAQLMKLFQRKIGVSVTGTWNPQTQKKTSDMARYFTQGKSSDPFWKDAKGGIQTIAGDRNYVTNEFTKVFDRPPTATELAYYTSVLQKGTSRVKLQATWQTYDTAARVTRIYKQVFGREPTAKENAAWSARLKAGKTNSNEIIAYLGSTAEGRKKAQEKKLPEGAEDRAADLNETLELYGLSGLKDWAWEKIKEGISQTRILQELRETDTYKQRFPAMATREAAGLQAISPGEYLAYERNAREILRRNGFPPTFYDTPDDYAALITADVSIEELGVRVNEGYKRVLEAPIEIRQAFGEMYGADGDSALAALFVDPDRAEAALLKQTRASETKGWGGLFGVDFSQDEAERVADVNLSPDQLRQGLGQLDASKAVFTESVSESKDLTAAKEGSEAVFGLGGSGASDIDERVRTRKAATSGGGGANISQDGIGVGASN